MERRRSARAGGQRGTVGSFSDYGPGAFGLALQADAQVVSGEPGSREMNGAPRATFVVGPASGPPTAPLSTTGFVRQAAARVGHRPSARSPDVGQDVGGAARRQGRIRAVRFQRTSTAGGGRLFRNGPDGRQPDGRPGHPLAHGAAASRTTPCFVTAPPPRTVSPSRATARSSWAGAGRTTTATRLPPCGPRLYNPTATLGTTGSAPNGTGQGCSSTSAHLRRLQQGGIDDTRKILDRPGNSGTRGRAPDIGPGPAGIAPATDCASRTGHA